VHDIFIPENVLAQWLPMTNSRGGRRDERPLICTACAYDVLHTASRARNELAEPPMFTAQKWKACLCAEIISPDLIEHLHMVSTCVLLTGLFAGSAGHRPSFMLQGNLR
jgi:hypothetical protein